MSRVSSEYGSALFMLAKEEGRTTEILESVREVKRVLDENTEYISLLSTPGIPMETRLNCANLAFDGRINEYVSSFILLLTERGHMKDFHKCAEEYEMLYNRDQGIAIAEVVSAIPLTDDERKALTAKLRKRSKGAVELRCTVDESLLGGIVVRMNGELIDGSLRSRINGIREVLEK